jgi:hypothetical protein
MLRVLSISYSGKTGQILSRPNESTMFTILSSETLFFTIVKYLECFIILQSASTTGPIYKAIRLYHYLVKDNICRQV